MDIHNPSCAPFGPDEEAQPENKKHRPQLQPFKWPSSTQLNFCPTRWYSTWDTFPSVPCLHHLRRQERTQLKQPILISWAPWSGGELSNTLSVRYLCRLWILGVWSEVSALRKCQNTNNLCARGKAGSPISCSAESSPSPPRTEGPRQKLMLWSSA